MDLKFLKWQLLRGPFVRRVILRAFMFVLAMIVLSLMQLRHDVRMVQPITLKIDECPLKWVSDPDFNINSFFDSAPSFSFPFVGPSPMSFKQNEKLIKTVFEELMEKNLLQSNSRVLCVGEGSASAVMALRHLGFFNAFGVENHPFFSLLKRRFVYELKFENNHFDFVFSGDLDRVSVPALLVTEIERVLRPGGTGVMLVGARSFYSGGLVRFATPLAFFLKSSDVVHVCVIGPYTLVIFKKRASSSFEHFQFPADCPSVGKNKPFMKYIEPLNDKRLGLLDPDISYLPKFMNISSRNRLIYINVGAGEYARESVAKMSKQYCSNHHAAFDVFIIDHRTSVLSSYVTDPGITFIYDPALSGDVAAPDISSDEFLGAPLDGEGFDFVRWFTETVSDGDFVVLMMNAKSVDLDILVDLFKTGAICHVDELFLRCPAAAADCKSTACRDCMNILRSLRKSGVFVHQWMGN